MSRLGLYLSIPFCKSKCTYCNFASGVYPAAMHEAYVDRLIADMQMAPTFALQEELELPQEVDSIYLGGGTPSLLSAGLIRRLFQAMRTAFTVLPEAEITLECAPGQIEDATLEAMVECGVNRVSFGVQSFVDREAALSGRRHTRHVALQDIERVRSQGIARINLDLIAGLAEQTTASWAESLDVLLQADVDHASVYMLEVDEDSRLGKELLAGGGRYHAAAVPDDAAIAAMYEAAQERLSLAGLRQYEISNFARSGAQSLHNRKYWERKPYLGLGLDASSMLRGERGTVLRWTTVEELQAYLQGSEPAERTRIDSQQQREEAWFLGLRLNEGIGISAYSAEFGAEAMEPYLKRAQQLIADGLLSEAGDRIALTPRGRLLSNEVFAEFLEVEGGKEQWKCIQ